MFYYNHWKKDLFLQQYIVYNQVPNLGICNQCHSLNKSSLKNIQTFKFFSRFYTVDVGSRGRQVNEIKINITIALSPYLQVRKSWKPGAALKLSLYPGTLMAPFSRSPASTAITSLVALSMSSNSNQCPPATAWQQHSHFNLNSLTWDRVFY